MSPLFWVVLFFAAAISCGVMLILWILDTFGERSPAFHATRKQRRGWARERMEFVNRGKQPQKARC